MTICNTLQHTIQQHTATHYSVAATHYANMSICNTLQHTIQQHTATHYSNFHYQVEQRCLKKTNSLPFGPQSACPVTFFSNGRRLLEMCWRPLYIYMNICIHKYIGIWIYMYIDKYTCTCKSCLMTFFSNGRRLLEMWRFWCNLNLYRGNRVFRLGIFQGFSTIYLKTSTQINVKGVYLPTNAEIALETPRTPLFTYTSIKLPCFSWTKPLKTQRKGCWCGRNLITKNLLVRFEWGTSHIWMSHVTSKCGMSHIEMSQVVLMNESWHTWTSEGTHINDPCHIYESWHTYAWVMAHKWTSPVTHVNGACHTRG